MLTLFTITSMVESSWDPSSGFLCKKVNPTFNEMPIAVIRDHNKIFYYKAASSFLLSSYCSFLLLLYQISPKLLMLFLLGLFCLFEFFPTSSNEHGIKTCLGHILGWLTKIKIWNTIFILVQLKSTHGCTAPLGNGFTMDWNSNRYSIAKP